MTQAVSDLKNSYVEWLQNRIHFEQIGDTIEITTPFLDRHNDYLQIYVTTQGNNRLRLTDAGYILDDLKSEGVNVLKAEKRKEIFNTVLSGYGVLCSPSLELYTETTYEQFPHKKHMLLQAMLTVNDMFMTSQSTAKNLFMEDVSNFLEEREIRFSPNVSFVGKSGFTQTFDFVIPKSKVASERIIKSVNSVSRQTASVILFNWQDTRAARGNQSDLVVVLNDMNREIPNDILGSFIEYEAKPILWSQREQHVSFLTA